MKEDSCLSAELPGHGSNDIHILIQMNLTDHWMTSFPACHPVIMICKLESLLYMDERRFLLSCQQLSGSMLVRTPAWTGSEDSSKDMKIPTKEERAAS